MTANSIRANITFDDFDSPIQYFPSQANWQTNDPSNAATFADYNAYLDNTYHSTDVPNAGFSCNFTGISLYVWGTAGPEQGSFNVTLDGNTTISTAYSSTNTTNHLLYSVANLTASSHSLFVTNIGNATADGGNSLTLDYITTEVELAPAGATITNTSIEEDNPQLLYTGTWGGNADPRFSGNGTSFTNENEASVSLRFNGSGIGVYGDKSNDHQYFTVTLDGVNTTLNAVAGCGGQFGKICEKTLPGLQYFASYLNSSEHVITVTNLAGVNNSFFDLDRFLVLTPSEYLSTANATGSTVAATSGASPLQAAMLLWPLVMIWFFVGQCRRS